tara:strand:- start:83 stop:811 length:729 start_codon:yes stop_codon:yes gene_type:complete
MSNSRDIADSAATINYIDTVTSNVQDQIDNLDPLPSQTGNSGEFLTTNGSAASWAAVDALPSQTGNSGEFLTTNGTVASWAAAGGGTTATANVAMAYTNIVDFSSLPAGISNIWINIRQCSVQNSSVRTFLQLSTSGGRVTSGYSSTAGWMRGATPEGDTIDYTSGLFFFYSDSAARSFSGSVHISKLANNDWVMSSVGATVDANQIYFGGGDVSLGGEITALRVTTDTGNWDAGTVNINYM